MSVHKSLTHGNNDVILGSESKDECLHQKSSFVPAEHISGCLFFLDDQICECTFASDQELHADSASQLTECLILQGRCGSRAWTCSRGEVDLQAMVKARRSQRCEEGGEFEMPNTSPDERITPDRRSSTSSTASSSLFDTQLISDSSSPTGSEIGSPTIGAAWSGDLDLSKFPDFVSSSEETSCDFDFFVNDGDFDTAADADTCLTSANHPASGTLSAGLSKCQLVLSRAPSWSSRKPASCSASSTREKKILCSEAKCNKCNQTFSGKKPERSLTRHMREVHWKEHKRYCDYCVAVFTREGNHLRHLMRFHKGKLMESPTRK